MGDSCRGHDRPGAGSVRRASARHGGARGCRRRDSRNQHLRRTAGCRRGHSRRPAAEPRDHGGLYQQARHLRRRPHRPRLGEDCHGGRGHHRCGHARPGRRSPGRPQSRWPRRPSPTCARSSVPPPRVASAHPSWPRPWSIADVEIPGVIAKGKLLTLTTTEALKLKVADFRADSLGGRARRRSESDRGRGPPRVADVGRDRRALSHRILSSALS